jgi:hypothetical protein
MGVVGSIGNSGRATLTSPGPSLGARAHTQPLFGVAVVSAACTVHCAHGKFVG